MDTWVEKIPQSYKLYKTLYTQEGIWVTPTDHFIWIYVNNMPVYITMGQIYRLGPNVYEYPHVPIRNMEETALAYSTMS